MYKIYRQAFAARIVKFCVVGKHVPEFDDVRTRIQLLTKQMLSEVFENICSFDMRNF